MRRFCIFMLVALFARPVLANSFTCTGRAEENPPVEAFQLEVLSPSQIRVNHYDYAESLWGPVGGWADFTGGFSTIAGRFVRDQLILSVQESLLASPDANGRVKYTVKDFEGWELYSTVFECQALDNAD